MSATHSWSGPSTVKSRCTSWWCCRRTGTTIHPNAAGLDVGATFHVVAVPPDRDAQPVRTFCTFSGDVHRLADWLREVGISTVAMESTGVYWIPVFEILEARGFE